MLNHIRRWNIWRKGCLNGPIYKILVLFGVIKSPTMPFAMLPEEVRDCFNCKKNMARWIARIRHSVMC